VKIKNVLIIILLTFTFVVQARTMVHPGMSHKLSDLERMKSMVNAGMEPWTTSFNNLKANSYASYNYVVKWSLDSTRVIENVGANYEKFKYDALACYYNALEWYITGDTRYAAKSVEILNKMRNIRSIESATESLCAGRVLPKLMEGAEIIKNTYSGWQQADIDAFKAMLVYPEYSTTVDHSVDAEHSFYWAMFNGDFGRHGNQGLFGMLGTIQIAVFSDNEIMYDRILRYMRGQTHRSDDLPYVSGPTNVKSTKNAYPTSNSYFDDYSLNSPNILNTVPDYGYNEVIKNYIWENGQTQEASRDQSHSQLALSLINNICEIAWNQGDDLYSILDNRPLLGFEYLLRYNLSYAVSFTDQPTPWEPTAASGEFIQRRDRSQRWFSRKINPWNANDTTSLTRGMPFTDASYTTSTGPKTPMYEMALGHYRYRLNLPETQYKWLNRADSISKKKYGYERQGFQVDYLGFGALTFRRAERCPGDPCSFTNRAPVFQSHTLPCTIQAEDYDYFTAGGQGRTFNELTGTKVYNAYRPDSAVTLSPCSAGGYKVTEMASGEWLTYTISVPSSTYYRIKVNYAATTAGGKLKFNIAGADRTSETTLPVTGANVWTDYTLSAGAYLSAGVQSLKVLVSGTSNALELNNIQLEVAPAGTYHTVSVGSGNWSDPSIWNSSMVPTTLDDVDIAAENAVVMTENASCKNLVLYPKANLTLNSGKTFTATSMTLKADETGTASFVDQGTSTITSAQVDQYLTSGRNWYISSPLTAAQSGVIKATSTNKLWYFNESTQSWPEITRSTTLLEPMIGYVATVTSNGLVSFTGGTLNTGVKQLNGIQRSGTTNEKRGFNLVGNPYPCWLNWNLATKTNLLPSIWYRTKNNANSYVYDSYNAESAVGTNNNGQGAVDQYISPMQSFWVYVNGDGLQGSLTLDNSMRSHQQNATLRNAANHQILRLQVSDGVNSDESILVFDSNAQNGFDNFDTPKWSNATASIPEIFTTVGSQELVINGLNADFPLNELNLGFRTGQSGNFTLKALEALQFEPNQRILLRDNLLNMEQNLLENPTYVFQSAEAATTDRFSLIFQKNGTNLTPEKNPSVTIFQTTDHRLAIQKNTTEDAFVHIYNLQGQCLVCNKITAETTTIEHNFQNGTFLVTVQLGGSITTKKVTIE
jgi:hypothetical protein